MTNNQKRKPRENVTAQAGTLSGAVPPAAPDGESCKHCFYWQPEMGGLCAWVMPPVLERILMKVISHDRQYQPFQHWATDPIYTEPHDCCSGFEQRPF
jgi:hypothetical protein